MKDKKTVLEALAASMLEKMREFQKQMNMMMESRNEDTKSSAGDKYETGRAMAQLEMDKLEKQMKVFETQTNQLKQFDISSRFVSIAPGAIFEASNGKFILGIPYGKLEVGEDVYQCISAESPFGKACMLKREHESFTFMQQEITIHRIL